MGALAPLPQWIPEDDLLLKNAIEAGASLESLAKGAVRFSRGFTIKELQDRWLSLLYDPEISAEASARMIDVDIEASISNHNHLKPGKTCNFRGKEWKSGKRKGDSLRCRYYAMRKRVCNASYSPIVDFLVPPSTSIGFDGDGCYREHLKSCSVQLDGDCILGVSMSDHFGIPESGFVTRHDTFPEMLKVEPDAVNTNAVKQDFQKSHMDIVGNQIAEEIVSSDSSFAFGGKVPPMSDGKGIGNNIDKSSEHKTEQKEHPQILVENLKAFENSSDVNDVQSPHKISVKKTHEADHIVAEPFPTFGAENDNQRPPGSGFVENRTLNSEVSDCSGSLHNVGFSSPLVSMSIWNGIDETPPLPMDASFDDHEQISTPALALPADDVKKMIPTDYECANTEQKLHDGIGMAALADPTSITEGDFVNLSLAFANDDELFLLNDGKDIIDRSCLDTLDAIFSDSPADVHHGNVYGSTEPIKLDMLNAADPVFDNECPGETIGFVEEMYSRFEDGHTSHCSTENMQEVPSKTPLSSEPLEGLMLCSLNTEDPEIPCNDDVILPNETLCPVSSTDLKLDSKVTGLASLSSGIISDDRRGMEEDQAAFVKPFASSLKILPSVHAKVGLMHHSDDCRIKTEFSDSDSLPEGHMKPGIPLDGTVMLSSTPVSPLCRSVATLKEEVASLDPGKCGGFSNSLDSHLEKSLEQCDRAKSNFQVRADICEKVVHSTDAIQKWASLHVELGCGDGEVADPSQIVSTSDQEEKNSDSEDDIPNFSDIEAMILDMDLGLSDQESSLFAREVSRYRYLDTKKAIMRLEQGAQSYMQRAIASHGAFAIFYGCHLKHYIKKPEVSLGRATDDVYVDIDLKREGPANKISRRQAIIRMDDGGSFHLKNTGKCPIIINGKEVLPGKQLNINSGCLIEIRGMKFIFEVNQNSVCRYLANVQRKSSEEQNSNL